MTTRRERRERRSACFGQGRSNRGTGIVILLIGAFLLLREVGVYFPPWFFTWPMILVAVGLSIGISHRFRDYSWLIISGIGFFFLADDIWPNLSFRNYLFPLIFIAIGLLILLKPRGRRRLFQQGTESSLAAEPIDMPPYDTTTTSAPDADMLDVTAVFGSVRKNVVSKNFRGGDIVTIFGGADINLTRADFAQHQITIESVNIFGGAKLIVPAHWQIRSEAVAIFGGIEDKRQQLSSSDPEKILVLQGFVMFGGIEIKSY